MVGEAAGNKRLFSKIEAGSDSGGSAASRATIDNEAELREYLASNLDFDAFDDYKLVSSKWLTMYTLGEAAPVVLAKGAAGKRVPLDVHAKLDAWYGTDGSVVALQVASRKLDFEIVDARADATVAEALNVQAGPGGSADAVWSVSEQDAALADVEKSGQRIALSAQVAELELAESNSLVVVSRNDALGHVGLGNMGNTCFMNSSLQALMHIPELALYFASGAYRGDLNRLNPIGCGGQVAEAFGELLREVYAAGSSSIRPADFLRTIGRFNRAFASRMQQDSQEFTAFLLDSLHEDLNRVHDKPLMEKPELPDNAPVTEAAVRELAERSWDAHKRRNDSQIMDLFTGMYKSTLICPVCNKVSITFDPFFDVTLPLPSSGIWTKQVSFLPALHSSSFVRSKYVSTTVALPPTSTVWQLKEQVAALVGLDAENLVAGDVYDHKFYRVLKDADTLIESIDSSDEIVLYGKPNSPRHHVPVYLRHDGMGAGLPFFLDVDEEVTPDSIRSAVLAAMEFLQHAVRTSASHRTEVLDTPEPAGTGVEADKISINVFEGSPDEIVYGYGGDRLKPLFPSAAESGNGHEEPFVAVAPGNPENEASAKLPTPASSPAPAPYSPSNSSSSISPLSTSMSPPEVASDANQQHEQPTLDPENMVLVVDVRDLEYVPHNVTVDTLTNPPAVTAQKALEDHKNTALEDCLRSFSQPEVLGDQDLWYCPRCKDFRKAQKQLELWRVPDVLMIHLKRFSGLQNLSRKINDLVTFPLENLDLREYISPSAAQQFGSEADLVYDLTAVDNHYGGMGGGHYTAYVKDFNGNWLDFNDSYVSPISPDKVCTEAAYLLFYKRRSTTTNNDHIRQQILQANSARADAPTSDSHTHADSQYAGSQSSQYTGGAHTHSDPPSPDAGPTTDSVFVGKGNVLGRAEDTSTPRLPWMDI